MQHDGDKPGGSEWQNPAGRTYPRGFLDHLEELLDAASGPGEMVDRSWHISEYHGSQQRLRGVTDVGKVDATPDEERQLPLQEPKYVAR